MQWCPRLQHGMECHRKGLNSQNLCQVCSRHMNKHTLYDTVVGTFSNTITSLDNLSVHPKWEVIPTSFIPPFQESKLSD